MASVCPSSVDSPHPKFSFSSVTLTKSQRGRTRKYSIEVILPMTLLKEDSNEVWNEEWSIALEWFCLCLGDSSPRVLGCRLQVGGKERIYRSWRLYEVPKVK